MRMVLKPCLGHFEVESGSRNIVDVELVDLQVDCINKEEAIKYVTDTLELDQRTGNRVELERDFWRREAVYSTGLGHGFAVPHCKTAHIKANSIGVFRLQAPIEWQSIDDKPVDVVIAMTIRDGGEAADTHMRIFSQLARLIMHEEFREGLRAIPDKNDMVAFLKEKLKLN